MDLPTLTARTTYRHGSPHKREEKTRWTASRPLEILVFPFFFLPHDRRNQANFPSGNSCRSCERSLEGNGNGRPHRINAMITECRRNSEIPHTRITDEHLRDLTWPQNEEAICFNIATLYSNAPTPLLTQGSLGRPTGMPRSQARLWEFVPTF
jgi:hypothetical protein